MKRIIATLLLLNCIAGGAAAAPSALDSWKGWLRDKHPDIDCPRIATQSEQRRCAWPGKLEITVTVTDAGAQFEQSWQINGASWIVLPGDSEHWPLQVTVNGKSAAVLERKQLPMLWLEPGNYLLRGNFNWNTAPQFLTVPAETALFDVNRDGKISAPTPDSSNRIWLRNNTVAQSGASDAVKLEVFRKIDDDLPRQLTTVLRLSVSGKARELLLGRFLLKDLEPLHFESPLPARIEDDGRLRIQARAGEWTLMLHARFNGDVNRLRMERLDEQWPAQEIWSFAANQSLRRVKVSGAASVDPSQLDLPDDFENLPTYLLEADNELVLEQQYRGDATPAANELSLEKTLWLDFDGSGATVRDIIRGQMFQSWRLQAEPGVTLGRVTVNGEPQLITRLGKDAGGGVEIRDANVNVDALSRIDSLKHLPASGWQSEFNMLRLSLQLPPGWKLWHASGPDVVMGSWLAQWNLWNIFLALLLVGVVYRLFDWRYALLALVTVALTYHEADSPVLFFIPLLVAIALLRVLTIPKLINFVTRCGYLFALALTLVLLVFAVAQIRTAIYPQLEMQREIYSDNGSAYPLQVRAPALAKGGVMEMRMAPVPAQDYAPISKRRYQANNNVQTGPGVPGWSWRSATLQWSGPVSAKDSLHLYLSGPWLTRFLKLLNVIVVTLLTLTLFREFLRVRSLQKSGDVASALPVTALILFLGAGLAMHPGDALAQEFPPKYLLDEFEQRLTKNPECVPACTAVESALVKIADDRMSIYLRVSAGADIAIPLPTIANWQPRTVLIDGVPKNNVARVDTVFLLPLSNGRHDVVLEGAVDSDDITLQFPLAPHDVAVNAEQWDTFGLNARNLIANTLQLQKRERTAQRDTLLQAPAKPFVRVTRSFDFDIDWTVTTTVTRIAPQQGAINVTLPLLPGEAILSNGIEAKDGKVAISFGSQQQDYQWNSILKPVAQLVLTAPDTQQWIEHWVIAASPRWHVTGAGINAVKNNGANVAQWRWQPWPGETLTLRAQQPTAVVGATTTVESAKLALTPAKHGSDLVATLAITSSIGGDYRVQLHEAADLKSVSVNGADVSQSRSDDKIVLPLIPGQNRVEIHWRLARGVGFITRTPSISLDSAGNNIALELTLAQDRWPLWLAGPKLGPAMLFWGVLVVIVGLAIALGKVVERARLNIPLRATQWLLLGIGMSTVTTVGSVPVVLWFFALEARSRLPMPQQRLRYNLIQLALVVLTIIAAIGLFSIIPRSLLSTPNMQISGNGSYNYFYRWYQDHSGQALPQALVFSVSLWIYRLAMLLWSLWLVFALLRWIKWGWQNFTQGGLWMGKPEKKLALAEK
jgi:hypothetical protein